MVSTSGREDARVVRVITRLNIGGPARQALTLTRELRREFPTTLITGTAPPEEGELTDPEVALVRIPLVRPIRPLDDAAAYRAIRRIVADSRPTIVHTHLAKAGFLGRMAARRSGGLPRTVHTFHGHVLEGYFPPKVSRAIVEFERRLADRTDLLVAVSEQTRDDLLRLGIGRPDQYRVIPLGLRLESHLRVEGPSGLLREAIGIRDDVPLVGVVGRLVPIKDVATVLQALVRIPGCHLAILGDGPERAALEAAASKGDISARTHFLGWWSDVPAAMADMDVVLLSSRNEGTPVALIEAAACARPVVAADVGGVSAVVEDGVTGHLVPPGDPEALAHRIADLLGDPEARHRMGDAGRLNVKDRFSEERLVADVAALYRELIH